MCIEAPESATHSLSCGFVEDGAGRHQTSEGEKNVALSFSLSLRIPFVIFPSLRAHRSCFKVSSQILERNDYAHEDQFADFLER